MYVYVFVFLFLHVCMRAHTHTIYISYTRTQVMRHGPAARFGLDACRMPYVYADYVCLTCIPHLQVFRKYDCAFLKSDVGQEPYVVRIEDMWEQVRTCGNRFTLSMRPYVCSHCVRTCGNRSRIFNLCLNPLSKTLIYTLRGDRGHVRTGLEGLCEQV